MVVVSTLAFLTMNGKLDKVSKGDLVRLAVENEKRVGELHLVQIRGCDVE